MANKLEKELQLVTGVKRDKDEEEQVYLLRLVTGVADLPEAAWNKLSEPAQEWYNSAAEAVSAGTPIALAFEASGSAVVKTAALKTKETTPEKNKAASNKNKKPTQQRATIIETVVNELLKEKTITITALHAVLDEKNIVCPLGTLRWYLGACKAVLISIEALGKKIQ